MKKHLVPALVLAVAMSPAAAAGTFGFDCQCREEAEQAGLCHGKADFSITADPGAMTLVMTKRSGNEDPLAFTITEISDAALSASFLRGNRQDGFEMTLKIDEGTGRYQLAAVLYTGGEAGLRESFSGVCTRIETPKP